VLFSEPKIPQYKPALYYSLTATRFSALQRAENSSIEPTYEDVFVFEFGFSALQRAENSSIDV